MRMHFNTFTFRQGIVVHMTPMSCVTLGVGLQMHINLRRHTLVKSLTLCTVPV
uniref:Uncharacterized protein n=1 Tax=Anguilla anguilla TaxID=7936 RepID=A0A0E9ULR7_ANGAN